MAMVKVRLLQLSLQLETLEAITAMVQACWLHNSNCSHTKVVIFDKDFTEQSVFEAEFPGASLIINVYFTPFEV